MTNVIRLKQELNSEEKLIYSLDQFNEYGLLEIYSKEIDAVKLKNELAKEFSLKEILVKKIEQGKKETIDGVVPEKIDIEEDGIKFLVNLKNDFPGFDADKVMIRELIKTYSKNKDVLDLVSFKGQFSIAAQAGLPKDLTIVEADSQNISTIKKQFKVNSLETPDIWEASINEFIDLAMESKRRWDLIILDFSTYNANRIKDFNLETDHVELIRRLQKKILQNSGFIIFITNVEGFVMDKYIRPGADKLTNKVIPSTILPLKPNKVFAFYN